MLSWYHSLRQVVARTRGAAGRDLGRRPRTVRPKVEALEDRWVPSGGAAHEFFVLHPVEAGQEVRGLIFEVTGSDPLDKKLRATLDGLPADDPATGQLGGVPGKPPTMTVHPVPGHPQWYEIQLPKPIRFKAGVKELTLRNLEDPLLGSLVEPPKLKLSLGVKGKQKEVKGKQKGKGKQMHTYNGYGPNHGSGGGMGLGGMGFGGGFGTA
jgi:hypothetical protein